MQNNLDDPCTKFGNDAPTTPPLKQLDLTSAWVGGMFVTVADPHDIPQTIAGRHRRSREVAHDSAVHCGVRSLGVSTLYRLDY